MCNTHIELETKDGYKVFLPKALVCFSVHPLTKTVKVFLATPGNEKLFWTVTDTTESLLQKLAGYQA